jgi:hypothetical protein
LRGAASDEHLPIESHSVESRIRHSVAPRASEELSVIIRGLSLSEQCHLRYGQRASLQARCDDAVANSITRKQPMIDSEQLSDQPINRSQQPLAIPIGEREAMIQSQTGDLLILNE